MKTFVSHFAKGFILSILFSLFVAVGHAQIPPFPTDPFLDSWSFYDPTNWFSDMGYAPIGFTNIIDDTSCWASDDGALNCNGLILDSTNAAYLNYKVVESDGNTNLICPAGVFWFWFSPDWSSTNQGGTGPGDWGEFIDTGAWTSNADIGWWSLYTDPAGDNIYFSGQTNGAGANYLTSPISWSASSWHLIGLVYSASNSTLYVDGQVATNGTGVIYWPGHDVLTNGFWIGSDATGTQQARGEFVDVETYSDQFFSEYPTNYFSEYYNQMLSELPGNGFTLDDGGPGLPGGGDDTNDDDGTNDSGYDFSYPPLDYGSNLWLYVAGVQSNVAGFCLMNTEPNVLYEVQSRTNLLQTDWDSQGFVDGSELTNWTVASVPVEKTGDLFLRIRSWQDSTDTGIPDWWWLLYFGQITNVDASASAAGDGFSNLQKFQMGLNPTNYYNPNPVGGFFGCLDATGTNVILEWSNAPGPVAGYELERGTYNSGTGNYDYTSLGEVSSNAIYFEDVGANTNNAAQSDAYSIVAIYPGGNVTPTNTWYWGDGSPTPGNLYAYADVTGTNVLLSWTPAQGPATNYLVEHGIYDPTNGNYIFAPVATLNTTATNYEVVGALINASNWGDEYGVAAVFPDGGLSPLAPSYFGSPAVGLSPVNVGSTNGPAAPTNLYGYTDSTGTNVYLNWDVASGDVTNYLLYGGNYNFESGFELYGPLGKVGAGTNSFEVAGDPYSLYAVVAAYTDGSLSQAATWDASLGTSGPGAVVAYVDWTGTNIMLAWSPVPGATGYVIGRSDYSGEYYYQIGTVSSSATTFEDVGGNNDGYGLSELMYQVQATYPNGGLSAAVSTTVATNPPAPSNLSASVNGTNAVLTWTPVVTPGISYTIERGVYNPSTGAYSYTQVGQTSGTTFTDTGAITGDNSYNDVYEVIANYPGGQSSLADEMAVNETAPPPGQSSPANNLTLAAQLVRNQTGRWQLMFSGLSTNVQTIALNWYYWDYFYDGGPFADPQLGYQFSVETDIPVSSLTNGVYVIPDYLTTNAILNGVINTVINGFTTDTGPVVMVQPIATDGTYGQQIMAGFLPGDEPAFADGREHLWQNLLFELRGATISQSYAFADTNYVESSFLHETQMEKGYGSSFYLDYLAKDDLWPFTANYDFHQSLYDTNYSGPSSFDWQGSVASIPAPAVLGISDPYWISQNAGDLADVGITAASNPTNSVLTQQNGVDNLFGLEFGTARLSSADDLTNGLPDSGPWLLPPGTPVTIDPGGASNLGGLYSQTADPSLSLVNYYFAPVITPGTEAPNENSLTEPCPLPALTNFASTNQTGVLIASVGTPTVIGGWGQFSLQNSSKYAYLGQYFETNAYLLDANGNITTNTTGVVSPYGDFFPTEPGTVAMITMPDYNDDPQGTGVVRVVALDVDGNHDGTMDTSYAGPDQTSPSRPLRFWANDDQDAGDDGGNGGIPGVQPSSEADGYNYQELDGNLNPIYLIHGTRDLVDFFPVYINIGSLFQSNALSAGIDYTDTNWQFVLSQADGVLRFVETDLTPTNYMNFLRDANEAHTLGGYGGVGFDGGAQLTTISNIVDGGAPLSPSFIAGIVTNNEGIILVEAATNTIQPLVLTIYHGTNQIAQTSLYLSISGVEQMFRSKTILLNPDPRTVPDRLTDASVPNEPDTTDKNFVFVHGYNVNPQQARGVAADVFKRMYWSGSHAKFWAVTWEGYDTQGLIPLLPNITTDYQSNVFNAFNTAPLLNNFLNSLSGTNIVTAHSLGNMVVLSALNDYSNQTISTYFMLDAAVPMEAIGGIGTNQSLYMTHSDWTDGAVSQYGSSYGTNLWASYWHLLFPTNDYRSQLTWDDRLANLQNANVYNFYSSGEEVLRTYPVRPTPDFSGLSVGAIGELWNGIPLASYVWNWQELLKGRMDYNTILGSNHGGWQFSLSSAFLVTNQFGTLVFMSPSQAASVSTDELKTNSFFNVNSYNTTLPDSAVLGQNGSSYAQTNQNRILSDAIPALTLPVGANPVPRFSPSGQSTKNFDMQALYENGWPIDRPTRTTGAVAAGEWHHSDFQQVAYTFTYPLFDEIVTLGNLK